MEATQESHPATYTSLTEHVVLAIAALIIIEQHSRLPEANFFAVIMCGAAIFGVAVAYFGRLMARTRKKGDARRPSLRAALSWLLLPATIALLLSSAATHWPLQFDSISASPVLSNSLRKRITAKDPKAFHDAWGCTGLIPSTTMTSTTKPNRALLVLLRA